MNCLKALQEYYLIGMPKFQEKYQGFINLKKMLAEKLDKIGDGQLDFNRKILDNIHVNTKKLWTDYSFIPSPSYFFYDDQNPDKLHYGVVISLIQNYYTVFEYKYEKEKYERTCIISEISDQQVKESLQKAISTSVENSNYIDVGFSIQNIIYGSYPIGQDCDFFLGEGLSCMFTYFFFDLVLFAPNIIFKKGNDTFKIREFS